MKYRDVLLKIAGQDVFQPFKGVKPMGFKLPKLTLPSLKVDPEAIKKQKAKAADAAEKRKTMEDPDIMKVTISYNRRRR